MFSPGKLWAENLISKENNETNSKNFLNPQRNSECWIVHHIAETEITGIDIDDHGTVYYTNTSGLRKLTREGYNSSVYLQSGLQDIALRNNQLYMCDNTMQRIIVYDLETTSVSILLGSEVDDLPHILSRCKTVQGLSFTHSGEILFATDSKIQKIDLLTNNVKIISGSYMGYEDGPLYLARFRFPASVIETEQGNILVVDNYNDCIREIKNGTVTTAVGIPYEVAVRRGIPFQAKDGTFEFALLVSPKCIVMENNDSALIADASGIRKLDFKKRTVSTLFKDEYAKNLCSMTRSKNGTVYAGGKSGLYILEPMWRYERLMWIGYLKESQDCYFARVPKDIIKEITAWLFYALTQK